LKADTDVKVTTTPSAQILGRAKKLSADQRAWIKAGYSGTCPVRQLLDRVGDTWTLLVILRLGEQPLRFRQLLKAVEGISQRMLTVTLRALERDGLVSRKVFDTKPPAVEYALTKMGESLLGPITNLTHWAMENDQQIQHARERYEIKSTAQ
jgi:DNA-binding HxlR family transcriptional regulator